MAVSVNSVWLQELSWQDVETYLDEADHPTAVVPIGSTEQHGPHLPLGVDSFAATDIAEAVGEALGVPVCPPIWYGDANHHLAFPGTVSLSTQTVVSVLKDVYESLIHHGFENIVTMNGHSIANLPAISTASKQTKEQHPDVFFGTIDRLRIGVRIHNELREGDEEDGMHAGEFETSYMLHKHPELVREEEFVKEAHGSWTRFASTNYVGIDDTVPTASSWQDSDEDALGHHGDPTLASAEKGERIRDVVVANGVEFVEDLWAKRDAEGSDHDAAPDPSY